MPELPEVQTIVTDLLAADLTGKVIIDADVHWPATIATSPPGTFRRNISGRTIRDIRRRAKLILFELDNGWLLAVHLRMTGRFLLMDGVQAPDKHVHVVIALADGRRLWFHDTRKFGRFYLVDTPSVILGRLGPEPLDATFTAQKLASALAGRRRRIKPLLLDQTFLAGMGNIYVDEALWAARIHPLLPAESLLFAEIRALHGAIRRVLVQGVRNAGTTLGSGQSNFHSLGRTRGRNADALKVFRRTSQPCPRCKAPIRRIQVAQRSTHVCEACQRSDGGGMTR
ncbi:MAG: bifunctional DNA-formamidopyrimidine glycosylase/DNA-(apurinic or apyrimidinic site) lyase [Desulfatitalea sp.]|nr:bifunctional DNA-formamidopyrimidine glycosylase/DNA-(apurinic or apyrimidinic site) lyase [Desulfatitalea sp.]